MSADLVHFEDTASGAKPFDYGQFFTTSSKVPTEMSIMTTRDKRIEARKISFGTGKQA